MRIIEVMGMNTRVFSPSMRISPGRFPNQANSPGANLTRAPTTRMAGTDDHQDVAESHLILEGIPADTLRSEDIGVRDE
jgi:hypothetical protein